MRTSLVLAALLAATLSVTAAGPQMAPPETPGMTRIFNGKDLTGWEGDLSLWSVKDGVIRGETTPENPAQGNTFLIWKDGTTRDFELRLSFRCSASNNSGIQYRSARIPCKPEAKNQWRLKGYQHEIRNEQKLPNVAGFIYDEGGKRGRICLVGEQAIWADGKKQVQATLLDGEAFKALFRLDDWNDVVIVAKGNRIRHYLNERLILDFTDDPALALLDGSLGLQLHAGRPMWTEFKDIRIKTLD
ncbi:MAG TPA: DUF1080 domain-containing protein [Kiritimatiellia bacterium]|nr:DUF1080 domain-containing protein [Kiritimatiellia bacterium]HRU69946.1 DUF1080 domain-containing protein [Kiritimatiellia bacterium]